MIYLNMRTEFLRAPAYIGSEPVQRATWLNLMLYVAERELGGRIAGCSSWSCRQWQQTCGVMKSEVEDVCGLWEFDGDDLILWEYPSEQEAATQAKRKGGRKGGLAKALSSGEAKLEGGFEAKLEGELLRNGNGNGNGNGNENGNGNKPLSVAPTHDPEILLNWWNGFAPNLGLPVIRKLTDKRKNKARTRMGEGIADDLEMIQGKIEVSDFLKGSTGWRADFDFIIENDTNWQKILEGKYDNKGAAKPTSTPEDAEMEALCKKVIEEESERIVAEYAIPEVSE
jgi:hypothetical protein